MDVDDRWHVEEYGVKVRSSRYGKGRRWRARWRDETNRQRSRSFEKKADAEAFVMSLRTDRARGTAIDLDAGKVTFKDFAESWRRNQVHRASTAEQVETNLRRHCYPLLGHRPLADVRPSEVQRWVRDISGSLQPATVRLIYGYTATIFRAAERDRIIARSPCVGIRLPKTEPKRIEPLSTSSVHALVSKMPDRYRALVVLAAGTGMRPGELLGLTTSRVDLRFRSVRVDRQLVTVRGGEPRLAPPKTAASHRTIPIGTVVHQALAHHLSEHMPPDAGEDDLLFTTEDGKPLHRASFARIWRGAADAAGLPTSTRAHDLRHYYASLLIRHGESVKTVQARLGHANAAETLNTYAHLWPDAEDRTREAVDAVLGSDVAPMWPEQAPA